MRGKNVQEYRRRRAAKEHTVSFDELRERRIKRRLGNAQYDFWVQVSIHVLLTALTNCAIDD